MRLQISAEPFFFGGAHFAAADVLALAVQRDDVPSAEFIAVIVLRWIARGGAEIIEIGTASGGMKFVVAGSRARARFECAPGFVVTVGKFFGSAIREGKVAEGRDGRVWDRLDDLGGLLRASNRCAVAMSPAARSTEGCSLPFCENCT